MKRRIKRVLILFLLRFTAYIYIIRKNMIFKAEESGSLSEKLVGRVVLVSFHVVDWVLFGFLFHFCV